MENWNGFRQPSELTSMVAKHRHYRWIQVMRLRLLRWLWLTRQLPAATAASSPWLCFAQLGLNNLMPFPLLWTIVLWHRSLSEEKLMRNSFEGALCRLSSESIVGKSLNLANQDLLLNNFAKRMQFRIFTGSTWSWNMSRMTPWRTA